MTRSWSVAMVGGLVMWFAACLPQDIEIEGKACPCVDGYRCESGVCTKGLPADAGVENDAGPTDTTTTGVDLCVVDTQCDAPTEVCIEGECALGCSSPEGQRCLPGETCSADNGRCVPVDPTCRFDTDCGGTSPFLICDEGACRFGCGTVEGACRGDRMCDSTGRCISPGLCDVDDDCQSLEFVCVGGACARRCELEHANPCRGMSPCDPSTGRCGEDLGVGADCSFSFECASGECLRLAGNPDRFCTHLCSATSECPIGTSCWRISGAYHCVRSATFANPPPLDLRSGEVCDGEIRRCQSLVCMNNTCEERCWRDRDCIDFGGTCTAFEMGTSKDLLCAVGSGTAPREACTADSECRSKLCDRDRMTCAELCCADADCIVGEHCVPYDLGMERPAGVCRPIPSQGTAAYGESCTADDECASGLCTPVAPVNPRGDRVCSTYCCNNNDCDALPGGGLCTTYPGPIGMTLSKQCRPTPM